MSTELCELRGVFANKLVLDKIADPEGTSLTVSGQPIENITGIDGLIRDGTITVRYIAAGAIVRAFQFIPDSTPFAQTAVDDDGQPVCVDC